MATGKRYYWIKLKDNFMASDEVDHLMFMSANDGINYIALYIMFCLKTANTGGRFLTQIGEVTMPYDGKHLKYACRWFSEKEIISGMNVFLKLGLLYVDDEGVLCITDFESFVGSETDYANQKRRQRQNKCEQENAHSADIVHTDIRDQI